MPRVIHFCHWPGCRETVPPKLFACKPHWYSLPLLIRRAIFQAYRPGQEIDKKPSAEYIAAAKAAQQWIKSRQPVPPANPPTRPFHETADE